MALNENHPPEKGTAMYTHIAGFAIKITEETLEKISILNHGIAPGKEELPLYAGRYFILPIPDSNGDIEESIIPGYVFETNYEFANPADKDQPYAAPIVEK